MNELRIRQLAGLSTDRSVLEESKKKFIAKVEVKEEPPEGLFATGSKGKIVKWLKSSHKDLKSAMSSLNFYINRAGKDLDDDRKAVLDAAKEALTKAYEVKEDYNLLRRMAGLPQIEIPVVEDEDKEEEPKDEEGKDKDEEEDLPSIIKKIAKSAEGKSGEELEELLMKVYNAGHSDAEKEEEAEEKGDEEKEEVKEGASVIQKGGSIGEQPNRVVKTFDTPDEAKEYAKRMNKNLSPGEKQYYGIKYVVVKDKEVKA